MISGKLTEFTKQAKYSGLQGPSWKSLKKDKVMLKTKEREKIMASKAVWHHGPKGEETPAVWKSMVNGRAWYTTHTHRVYNVMPTLKGAVNRYHDFVKGTV